MKSLNKRMPFRPMPFHGELFKGYIIRLASRNGRDELKDFVKAFEIAAVAKRIYVVGTPEHQRFIEVLSNSMGVDCAALAKYFEQEKEVQVLDWLSSRHILVNHPSVCPKCVAKHGYLKADWHLYYATHCHEHECKLWNRCPQCGKLLTWNGMLLDGCPSCALKWKNVSPIKAELPSSQVALSNVQGQAKLELIKQIILKLNIGLRPFDASFQKLRDIDKYVCDLEAHVEHAFQLAHSKDAMVQLKVKRIQHWQSKVAGKPQVELFNKLDAANDYLFNRLDTESGHTIGESVEPKESSHQVLTSHRRLNASPDKACLELTWPQLKDTLKINEERIKSLIRGGLIPGRMHMNSPDKVSPCRVDDVVAFFRDIKQQALPLVASNDEKHQDEFIAWGDDKALSKYKLKTHELIKPVSSGELPIYAPDHHDHVFEDFRFCASSLEQMFGSRAANTDFRKPTKKQSA
ncbi:MAG: TniQ family protein [Flavobacteriaceae bacterium]|nr:TniQ family protein [Flavobacteriaceae bacterium]